MEFQRNELISRFPWIHEKNHRMVISADYDGLICAAFLHHHLNWDLVGYYDLNNIWISEKGLHEKKKIIWVDLNILPRQGRAIGGHIVSLNGELPRGFKSSWTLRCLQIRRIFENHILLPQNRIDFVRFASKSSQNCSK